MYVVEIRWIMIHKHAVPGLHIRMLAGWIRALCSFSFFLALCCRAPLCVVLRSTAHLPESAATKFKAATLSTQRKRLPLKAVLKLLWRRDRSMKIQMYVQFHGLHSPPQVHKHYFFMVKEHGRSAGAAHLSRQEI